MQAALLLITFVLVVVPLWRSSPQSVDRLEQVHKGLAEMQSLAVGVGDLKRMLTNVKLRGTWGDPG